MGSFVFVGALPVSSVFGIQMKFPISLVAPLDSSGIVMPANSKRHLEFHAKNKDPGKI